MVSAATRLFIYTRASMVAKVSDFVPLQLTRIVLAGEAPGTMADESSSELAHARRPSVVCATGPMMLRFSTVASTILNYTVKLAIQQQSLLPGIIGHDSIGMAIWPQTCLRG
jgi:hypothetical protein